MLESGGPRVGHQLFFDRMKLRQADPEVHKYGRWRGAPPKPPPAPAARPAVRWVQLSLFEAHRTSPASTSQPVSIWPTRGCAGRSTWPINEARPAVGAAGCVSGFDEA